LEIPHKTIDQRRAFPARCVGKALLEFALVMSCGESRSTMMPLTTCQKQKNQRENNRMKLKNKFMSAAAGAAVPVSASVAMAE